MNKKPKRKLHAKRGAISFEALFAMFVGMFLIAFGLKIFPVFLIQHKLDIFANELCRECEIKGSIGGAVIERMSELKDSLLVPDDILFDGTETHLGTKVQLDGKITVRVTKRYDIGFGGLGSFPVDLEATATGRSEVFFK